MARSRIRVGVGTLLIGLWSACSGGNRQAGDEGATPAPRDGEQRGDDASQPPATVGADLSPGRAPEVFRASGSTSSPRAIDDSDNLGDVAVANAANAPAVKDTSKDTPGIDTPDAPVAPRILTAGAWDDNRNFDSFLAYRDGMWARQVQGLVPFSDDDHRRANDAAPGSIVAHATLDVALIIDTTGSMGDELRYLQSEFEGLSQTIANTYPQAWQRWSLVVYRDTSDEYVTRWFDFRADLADFRAHLAAQVATGGGDFPEAADQALARAAQLSWRTDTDTARLAFWVADAPHHVEQAQAMHDAIASLQTLGIHVYPVASSGIDERTEETMRATAQLTLGRYLFLTDDSGIGDPHKTPSIACYFVTKLDDAILRMVDIEMTGLYREPAPREILRTGGDPQDGACTLSHGDKLVAF